MTPTVKFALFEQTLFSCDLTLKLGDGARGGYSLQCPLKNGPKGLTDEFYGFKKSRQRSIFVNDSYLKDSAFKAVKRDVKF